MLLVLVLQISFQLIKNNANDVLTFDAAHMSFTNIIKP
jgi:hypothetical protein